MSKKWRYALYGAGAAYLMQRLAVRQYPVAAEVRDFFQVVSDAISTEAII